MGRCEKAISVVCAGTHTRTSIALIEGSRKFIEPRTLPAAEGGHPGASEGAILEDILGTSGGTCETSGGAFGGASGEASREGGGGGIDGSAI